MAFPQPQLTALLVRTSSVRCRHSSSSYCQTKRTQRHSALLLSVFRGNFTPQRNDVNENKGVFQFSPGGVEGERNVTHITSLDISNSSSAEELTSFTFQLATPTVPQMG